MFVVTYEGTHNHRMPASARRGPKAAAQGNEGETAHTQGIEVPPWLLIAGPRMPPCPLAACCPVQAGALQPAARGAGSCVYPHPCRTLRPLPAMLAHLNLSGSLDDEDLEEEEESSQPSSPQNGGRAAAPKAGPSMDLTQQLQQLQANILATSVMQVRALALGDGLVVVMGTARTSCGALVVVVVVASCLPAT